MRSVFFLTMLTDTSMLELIAALGSEVNIRNVSGIRKFIIIRT